MDSDILKNCKIEVKEPNCCTDLEISSFYEEVKKGGKVMLHGLINRIRNCELLAFCYHKNTLVGVSSIKRPNPNYVADIINKAEIDRKIEELNFEVGYSYTEPHCRRKGISKELKSKLLEQMKSRGGTIFSTTAIKSSQRFLEENGFKKLGKSYDGENDKGIVYYERTLNYR